MSAYFNGKKDKELHFNGKKIEEAYFNGEKVFSSGPLYYCYQLYSGGSGTNFYSYSRYIIDTTGQHTLYGKGSAGLATNASELVNVSLNTITELKQDGFVATTDNYYFLTYYRYPQGDLT
ncbi:MAG: hypothetical protein IJS26_05430 [Alphaproteobacteria bacterium]|nr:hypothetical protein [Alphaproteobacteria bacterium]